MKEKTIGTINRAIPASAALAFSAMAQGYDLVILRGRVMDTEAMFAGVAHVGGTEGGMAAITKAGLSGKEAIDAKGRVVAPGFKVAPRATDQRRAKTRCRQWASRTWLLAAGSSSRAPWCRP